MSAEKPLILVVENDSIQRDLIKLALSRMECQVVAVQHGAEALAVFERATPKVVLLDLFLPQMSGLEVIERLRENGKIWNTTIIVISSFGFPEVVEQAKETGAYDFIIKPFEGDLLIKRVKKALQRRR